MGKSYTWLWVIGAIVVLGVIGYATGMINLGKLSLTEKADSTGTGGSMDAGGTTDFSGAKYPIETFAVNTQEKYSNSFATVNGNLSIYPENMNPSDPNAGAVDTVSVASGTGSTTDKLVKSNTKYRVVFDGGATYYDKDFGIMSFTDVNPERSVYTFDTGEILKIGTIDDALDETATSGIINGQTTCVNATAATNELGIGTDCSADSTVTYDESVGDGVWYIEPTFSASSANTALKDFVTCFEWDASNPPEGNEMSSVTTQGISGKDFGLPSDILNYWKNEQCLSLGSEVKAGSSGKVRFTFSTTEANLDTTDDFTMKVDDMGSIRGKDVRGDNVKATLDTITIDAQA